MDISPVNYHLIEILGNVKDLSDIHYVVDGLNYSPLNKDFNSSSSHEEQLLQDIEKTP